MNDKAEFVDADAPRLMRINGDFIEKVHAHEAERAEEKRSKLVACVECGCKFAPRQKGQTYCSQLCACRANARKAQVARRAQIARRAV